MTMAMALSLLPVTALADGADISSQPAGQVQEDPDLGNTGGGGDDPLPGDDPNEGDDPTLPGDGPDEGNDPTLPGDGRTRGTIPASPEMAQMLETTPACPETKIRSFFRRMTLNSMPVPPRWP